MSVELVQNGTGAATAASRRTVEIPEPDPAKVAAYHRAKRICRLIDIPWSLAYWGVMCWAAPFLVDAVAGGVGNRWVGLLLGAFAMLAIKTVIDLPMDFYSGFTLEHRFSLSNQTFIQWAIFQVKAWAIGAVIGSIVVLGLYALLWHGGRFWSVWAWAGLMVLAVGLAKVFPLLILPIFYPARPLDRPSLTTRLTQLADGTGLTITGVFDLALSKDTKKANAMLAGLGSSRRVYLSDTLLDAFTDDQIAVVFAHELGHHIRGHIYKGIALSAVSSSIMMALVHWLLNPYAGHPAMWAGAVAALAQVILVTNIYSLVLMPVSNAISRHFERQCDSDALRLTDDPASYRAAFELLGRMNMAELYPPRWEEILFDDHPAMGRRLAMAAAYEQQCGRAANAG